MLLIAFFGIWLAGLVNRARHQEHAVDAVLELGGQVGYAHQTVAHLTIHKSAGRLDIAVGMYDPSLEPHGPVWLRELLGAHYFVEVSSISLSDCRVTDSELSRIRAFKNVRVLTLKGAQVSDQALAHLKGLTALEVLDLDRNPISDCGLIHLRGLKNLELLSLNGTEVTDAGLVNLKGLKKLRVLYLGIRHPDGEVYRTHITDAGLQHLKGLTQLEVLHVGGTGVTMSGEQELQKTVPNLVIGR